MYCYWFWLLYQLGGSTLEILEVGEAGWICLESIQNLNECRLWVCCC